ncbi:hypothetical protein DFS34DRAFT_596602 [Phlyctochytrium arcticum]|nr:hypothetical protein DFS34DRAFT_596602 [Phlyctochytrium arcticum]
MTKPDRVLGLNKICVAMQASSSKLTEPVPSKKLLDQVSRFISEFCNTGKLEVTTEEKRGKKGKRKIGRRWIQTTTSWAKYYQLSPIVTLTRNGYWSRRRKLW